MGKFFDNWEILIEVSQFITTPSHAAYVAKEITKLFGVSCLALYMFAFSYVLALSL